MTQAQNNLFKNQSELSDLVLQYRYLLPEKKNGSFFKLQGAERERVEARIAELEKEAVELKKATGE